MTGLTQTVRNFGGSLGLAVLGSILITQNVSRVGTRSAGPASPADQAERDRARDLRRRRAAGRRRRPRRAQRPPRRPARLRPRDPTVVYGMAAAMAVAFVVALVAMPPGRASRTAGEGEPEPASVTR